MNASDDEQQQLEHRVGPVPTGEPEFEPYHRPAAGWGPRSVSPCALGDYSTESNQPIMKHLKVRITAAG
ncbi:hypothetical protein P3T35_002464 [Kitasatospora sp. GP30]|uniref:hypothetical protein n=1 Tax=Kitasatospora sp. GP30 TaxID=3035084 RepID=UPI0015D59C5D|nr:hypothetical protein [Kitasatospora sp. GP30]MDH6140456.1 hypothetical protein [Kitasatospora sp. GP30]